MNHPEIRRAIGATAAPRGPFFIVINGVSGSDAADSRERVIRDQLEPAGRSCEFLAVPEHDMQRMLPVVARRAVELAQRMGGCVVAAGGDGTVNAVAQAALGSGVPLGVLPQGTFNYFARTHGIPLDGAEAARALLDARVRPVQVGLVNGRVFLVNASIGLYPRLLEDRETFKQRYGRSRLVALFAAIATLLREHRKLHLEIERGGVTETLRTPTLFVGNNALQLAQLGLPEAATVGQGELAAISLGKVGSGRLLGLMLRGALGQLHDDERIDRFTFRHMTVGLRRAYGRRNIKVATDGEIIWMHTPLRFELSPEPLELLLPARPAEPR
ncbi:diacylglycerol/lipid kinase family protein [Chitinimonas koreensis]|uniref:diacylglycerol/lipid kinase family protein n=1 Tax=Chitinimonas koreensis TaxID=356302 RepID=UPI00041F05AD|nr:diacylglycerol kinase family protein [Chitinimonas koreensis]QNM97941.1 diacylglycerol kinase [Chitinimonas koreensis]